MAGPLEGIDLGTGGQAGRAAGRGLTLARGLLLCGAGLGAAVLFGRSSARPVVLGRYSPAYAALLLAYLIVASLAVRTAWSASCRKAARQAWEGFGARAGVAWAALLGIPSGLAVLAAEDVLARGIVPLACLLLGALALTLIAPAAARRPLALLGRWGRGPVVTSGALVMAATLAGLVAIELLLRIWQPTLLGRGPYVMDPAVGGFRIDHGSEGNRLGFRDRDAYAVERNGVAYRAVAIGDSFTMGTIALEETWKHRLEARLNQGADGRIEVINLGIAGTGPADYLRVLRTLGLRLAPDLVLVGFYVGNDLTDNEPGRDLTIVNGWPMEVRHRAWFGGLTPERFYLMTYLTRGLKPVWDAYRQRKELEHGEVHEEGTFSRETFLERRRHWLPVYERAEAPWYRRQWAAVEGWLGEMHQRTRARGAEFVLVLFPDQIQVEDGLRREVLEYFHLDGAAYDFEKPQRLLRTFAAEAGIRVVDMLPRFRGEGRGGGLYLVRDSHWNAEGHRLAADILYEYLMAEHMVLQRAQAAR